MHKPYGLRAVKLTEIPLEQRLRAARLAVRHQARDAGETSEIIAAALCPSDRIYWVREQAAAEAQLVAA